MEDTTTNVPLTSSSTSAQSSRSSNEVKEETDDKSTVVIVQVGSSLQVIGINQMDCDIKKDYDSDCDCEDCRVQKAIALNHKPEAKPFMCKRYKCRKLCVKKDENDDNEITSKEITGNQTNSEERQVGNDTSLPQKRIEEQEAANRPCSATPDNVPPLISESDDDDDDDTEIDDEIDQDTTSNIVEQNETNPNSLDSQSKNEINENKTDDIGFRSPNQLRRSKRMHGKPTKSYREEFFVSDNESDYELSDGETTEEESEVEERSFSIPTKRKRENTDEDSYRESSVRSKLNNNFKRKNNSAKSVAKNNEENCFYEVLSLKCMICQKLTKKYKQQSAKSKLDKHIENVHRIQKFRCSLLGCFVSFKNPVALSKHLKTKHSRVSKWKCEHCSKVMSSNPKLNRHITYEHQPGHYRCKFPSCEFESHQSRQIVRKHFYENHKIRNSKSLLCPVVGCGKVFKTKEGFSFHEATHSDVRPFQCEHCKSGFKRESILIQHMRGVHFGLQPYYCNWPNCNFQFYSKKKASLHVQKKHFKTKEIGDTKIFVKKRTDEEYDGAPLVKRPHRQNCSGKNCDNPGHRQTI